MVEFFFPIDCDAFLLDLIDGDLILLQQYLLRILHVIVGKADDRFRHRRAEECDLSVCRELAQDLAYVINEAHVEHAVCLIEYDIFDSGEVYCSAFHVVEQSARCCDRDLCCAQFVDLGVDANASIDCDRLTGAELLRFFVDLQREFSCWCEDESLQAFRESLKYREQECECFSAAGFRANDQVFALEHDRDRFCLYFCWCFYSYAFERL